MLAGDGVDGQPDRRRRTDVPWGRRPRNGTDQTRHVDAARNEVRPSDETGAACREDVADAERDVRDRRRPGRRDDPVPRQ
jgi:hypothetical protein